MQELASAEAIEHAFRAGYAANRLNDQQELEDELQDFKTTPRRA